MNPFHRSSSLAFKSLALGLSALFGVACLPRGGLTLNDVAKITAEEIAKDRKAREAGDNGDDAAESEDRSARDNKRIARRDSSCAEEASKSDSDENNSGDDDNESADNDQDDEQPGVDDNDNEDECTCEPQHRERAKQGAVHKDHEKKGRHPEKGDDDSDDDDNDDDD